MGGEVGVASSTGAVVAVGNGVAVGVGCKKGIGMDSLHDAASTDKASAVGRRNQANLVRTRPRALCSWIPSYMTEL